MLLTNQSGFKPGVQIDAQMIYDIWWPTLFTVQIDANMSKFVIFVQIVNKAFDKVWWTTI